MKFDRETYGTAFNDSTDAGAIAFLIKRAGFDRRYEPKSGKEMITADQLADRIAGAEAIKDSAILRQAVATIREDARRFETLATNLEDIGRLIFGSFP